MKQFFTIIMAFVFTMSYSQTTVFQDDFESGLSNWNLTNNWGTTSASAFQGTYSLTESPSGNYTDNETSYATMANGIDLSQSLNAELSFFAKYNIEGGFDYMYLEVSPNGGSTWVQIDSYDDTSSWNKFDYSLGGYVGNSNVKIRFRFVSDGAVNYDGMYIDDIVITSDTVDNADPLILHNEPEFYQSSLSAYVASADIIDISGVAEAWCYYRFDGGAYDSTNVAVVNGNTYDFTIPQQTAGTLIEYYFVAIDSSQNSNIKISDLYSVIQGDYISYDNGVVDFVDSTGAGGGRAVKINLPNPTQITTLLIRNYTDVNRPNDSMMVHVWDNNGGVPGNDVITPFKVYPWATLQNTSPMTVIDLRKDSADLKGISGTYFVGFTVPSGGVWVTITQPGITTNRSYAFDGTSWSTATGTSGGSDYHFRVITSDIIGLPTADFTFDTTQTPTVSFTNNSADADSYSWDFGDYSGLDTNENPSHTYPYNGNYKVCLTATNVVGNDSVCKYVNINSYPKPISMFTYDDSLSPEIHFFDQSQNNPTSWLWIFDDNGAQSGMQNPVHIFSAQGTNPTYNVCMTATSINGTGNTYCENITILTGIEENEKSDLKVIPNPFIDEALIEIELENTNELLFNVYDIKGKLIKVEYKITSRGILIKNTNLKSGRYIYEVINNNKVYKGSIIVL